MPLARAISRGAFLKARLGVNGIQKDSRSLGTALARASLLACGMSASLLDFLTRAHLAPEISRRYSSRRARAKSAPGMRRAPDCRKSFPHANSREAVQPMALAAALPLRADLSRFEEKSSGTSAPNCAKVSAC